MEKTKKISVEQCCIYYSIETSFVQALNEHGILKLSRSGKEMYVTYEQLPDLEKYMRLHYDLKINLEGIHAIKHLLDRMQQLQRELNKLQGEISH